MRVDDDYFSRVTRLFDAKTRTYLLLMSLTFTVEGLTAAKRDGLVQSIIPLSGLKVYSVDYTV